jgi:hypothetical protein
LSETALWLNYCLSGVVAFLTTYFWRWRFVLSVLFGTAVSLAAYSLVSLSRGGSVHDPWFGAALLINGLFALVPALAGAGLASELRWRPRGD